MSDPLFPALPEDLSALDRAGLEQLETEHVAAMRLIRENNDEFLSGLNDLQIVEQTEQGNLQLRQIRDAQSALAAAEQNFTNRIAELTADAVPAEDDDGGDGDEGEVTVDPPAKLAAEVEEPTVEEIPEPIAASVEPTPLRRPPAPTREARAVIPEPTPEQTGALLTASIGADGVTPGQELDPPKLGKMVRDTARRLGKPVKSERGVEERYLLASAAFPFPEERILTSDIESNAQKVRMIRNTEQKSLLASGGLCAPLTPIYSIPQFATNARPVRDALPSFMADRGGLNVPIPLTLASANDAITIITEAEDALGGTFATKACLDQTCLSFTETVVTIISHCREYGNLNARAWPESITYENELTMAEHARVAEQYLLSRIKAQSIQVTTPDVYSSTWDLINAAARAVSGIRYRLRTGPNFRFRALFPEWVREMTVTDIAGTQFDRFQSVDKFSQIMRSVGVEPSFYLDDVGSGTSQGFADEVTGVLDEFPDVVQWALFPEGAFIHVDGGTLELGLVRDSTLNSTNDFQFFGESFENVALLAPAQAALWITSTVCPSGEFPALTTALSC